LEPHRFEDLVRQLLYDFKNWTQIEATGRSGGDDGFDARAWERGEAFREAEETEEDAEVNSTVDVTPDRQWLVQCKRERTIGPSQLVKYLANVPSDGSLTGIVFVAACDFSKKARDAFRAKARELGIEEAHLWGKGELEDQLFQPKNDHLLFAYFGISLQKRQRSMRAAARSIVTTKRKIKRFLHAGMHYLVRDVTDTRYPWREEAKDNRGFRYGRWRILKYRDLRHDGLWFEIKRHYAYISDTGDSWDWLEAFNLAAAFGFSDPWADKEETLQSKRMQALEEWSALPEENRAFAVIEALIPFEAILDIDDIGDDWFDRPHILYQRPSQLTDVRPLAHSD
jgi:hypothetical protein